MSTPQKAVLIIIVNYKGYRDTIECLETVLKLTYIDFKIIVIDNSDDNESQLHLNNWITGHVTTVDTKFEHLVYPLTPKPIAFNSFHEQDIAIDLSARLTIIKSENRGFAAANNLGIRLAKDYSFDLYWLLNNDTVVEPSALSELVSYISSAPDIGITGSKLLFYQSPSTVQGIGGVYNKWIGKVKEIARDAKESDVDSSLLQDQDYVIGASMFVDKRFVESVGLMNEDLFLYYEELDWALRGKLKGWRSGACLESKVYHKMGASINKQQITGNSLLSDFYSVRNRILIAKKFFSLTLITLYPSFLLFCYNRIKLKQYSRIAMLVRIIMHPSMHIGEYKKKYMGMGK